MAIRFYSQGAPSWWPYHVLTLSSPNLPVGAFPESVIVDNNAFTFYRRGSFPQLDQWVARIARVAHRASSFSAEVVVVLPDCPLDPLRTLLWAKRARWLCKHYRCMAVMHYDTLAEEELESTFESYAADVDAHVYAVPLKLPLSTGYSRLARRVNVDPKLQKHVVRVAARVVGGKLHLMAPRKETIVSMWDRIESFDTTAWTRASAKLKRKLGTISCRNQRERELMFAHYIVELEKAGVDIHRSSLAKAVLEAAGVEA